MPDAAAVGKRGQFFAPMKLAKMFALPGLPPEFSDPKFRHRFRMQCSRLIARTTPPKHPELAGQPRSDYRKLWARKMRKFPPLKETC